MASDAREVANVRPGGARQTTVDWSAPEPVTETLTTELEEVLDGRQPAERLWDRVDPEALEQLFCHAHERGDSGEALRVSFKLNGYLVTVVGNGDVFARPTESYE